MLSGNGVQFQITAFRQMKSLAQILVCFRKRDVFPRAEIKIITEEGDGDVQTNFHWYAGSRLHLLPQRMAVIQLPAPDSTPTPSESQSTEGGSTSGNLTSTASLPESDSGSGQTQTSSSGQEISREEAFSIALENAGVSQSDARNVKIERDGDNGIPIYDIEFDTDYGDYDYEVAVSDGSHYRQRLRSSGGMGLPPAGQSGVRGTGQDIGSAKGSRCTGIGNSGLAGKRRRPFPLGRQSFLQRHLLRI